MDTNVLRDVAELIDYEVKLAKQRLARRQAGGHIEDFDIRGRLYGIAMALAPEARSGDLVAMRRWLRLHGDEKMVDLAAGTGFFTREFSKWTRGDVIAVDTAMSMMRMGGYSPGSRYLIGSPDDAAVMNAIAPGSVGVVSSFGGIHHVPNQRVMMEQVARILRKGGRFAAADVCADTNLARHFDNDVAKYCLTGHRATWLSVERLRQLIDDLPLKLTRTKMEPLVWEFSSREQMGLFFKGLHAFDLTTEEIVQNLQESLGFRERIGGKIQLNWEMLFFEIKKT